MFILPAGRHDMLFQCANMYDRTGHSNTKYNIKYNCFGIGSFRDLLCRFAKVNHDLTTQLSIIITGLQTQTLHKMYSNISKMVDQCRPVNPRMQYMALTVTSSGCIKLYLNP